MTIEDRLLNIVFPILEILNHEKEIVLNVLGLVEQLGVGFKLVLKKNFKPVFSRQDEKLVPNPDANWVEQGVVFQSLGDPSNLFVEFLSILIGKRARLQAKESVPFSALLLMGEMGNFQNAKLEENYPDDVSLLHLAPAFESDDPERLPYLYKFKLEFTDRNFSDLPIQFLLSIDTQEMQVILSEKNLLTREHLLKVFSLKDLVNGSSLEAH